MLFRQLFESQSSTYTYVVAAGPRREAFIIDPVKERIADYLQVVTELDLKLVIAIDTHTHADHITALGGLRESTLAVLIFRAATLTNVAFDR